MKTVTALVIFLFCLYLSPVAAAPVPLPVITLVSSAGVELSTESIGKDKGVVLLLIRKGNPSGKMLLSLLETSDTPLPADRLLVVVGGADEKVLKVIAEDHRKLAATWYRDPDDALAKGLNSKVTPMLAGVGDGMVAWTIPGTSDLEFLEKTVSGWLNR